VLLPRHLGVVRLIRAQAESPTVVNSAYLLIGDS
jgi:hypothetical protein